MKKSAYKTKEELIAAIDKCQSISQLFALVRSESIELRMQCLSSASCIAPKPHNIPTEGATTLTPLARLKCAVRDCVLATR